MTLKIVVYKLNLTLFPSVACESWCSLEWRSHPTDNRHDWEIARKDILIDINHWTPLENFYALVQAFHWMLAVTNGMFHIKFLHMLQHQILNVCIQTTHEAYNEIIITKIFAATTIQQLSIENTLWWKCKE